MKKHILAVLLTVICLVLVLSLASCGGTKDSGKNSNSDTDTNTETGTNTATDTETDTATDTETNTETETDTNTDTGCVEHDFSEWTTVTEATCAAAGLEKSVCSVCGEESEREIPKTQNHSWSDWTTTGGCASDGENTRSCSVCGATESKPIEGHPWTEWGYDVAGEPFVQEPTCKSEGYEGRMCSNCGLEDTRPISKLSHQWGDWIAEGDCVNGATRTRACISCGEGQSETIPAGEHANIVYEGAKAPTATEDGSTGTKICKSCGETLALAKVLRIMNVSSEATVTSNASHWQVVGNGGWAPNTLPYLIDGKYNTGTPSCANTNGTQWFMLTFENAIDLNNIVIVCNGSGNVGALGDKNDTNCNTDVTVIFLDENGEILSSETKNTADVTSITFENNTESNVKQIQVSYPNISYKADILYIWEIEVYAIKELTPCEVTGSHTWGDWVKESDAYCTQEGLVNGKNIRTCSACGEVEEEVVEATHEFGEWVTSDVECLVGGTKTRECEKCHLVETEVVEQGGHIDVVIEGAIEPTFEAEGSTGKTVCKACGATIEDAKTISKLVYVEDGGTVTTSSTFWASSKAYDLQKIIDGNRETGLCSTSNSDDGGKITDTITFKEANNVREVVLVVNGKGSTTEGKSYSEVTNKNYVISFVLYDVDGNVVFTSEKYQTLDQVEITVDVDLPDEVMVKSMSILRETGYVNDTYLWEVEVIGGGVIQ